MDNRELTTNNNTQAEPQPINYGQPPQTFNNQLNAGAYYGLNNPGACGSQGCVSNTLDIEGFTIPSIGEIAAYNNAILYDSNQPSNGSSGQNVAQTGNNEPMQQTPATVLDYGATIENGLSENMGFEITDINNPYPVSAQSIQYLNGFIRTQIGRRVSIDFLVGSNTIVTKSGYLLGVASNYILINELDTNDITTCDFYNIKFIRFYY